MGQKGENLSPKDRVTIIFESSKTKLLNALKHPLIPNFVFEKIRPVLENSKVLNDDEFRKAQKDLNVPSLPPNSPLVSKLEEEIKLHDAIYMPSGPNNKQATIIIRKGSFGGGPNAEYLFKDLLAEEAAHSLSIERKIPLKSIKDNSFLISPFHPKSELLRELDKMRREFFGQEGNISEEKITVLIRGFRSEYVEEEMELYYPIQPFQAILEETRSANIQTIFEIIMDGMSFSPQSKPDEQFNMGLKMLLNNFQSAPELYQREIGAMIFIRKYFEFRKDLNLEQILNKFFRDLYYKTLDKFVSNLRKEEHDAFTRSVDHMMTNMLNTYFIKKNL
jgi:hypothetical protein